MDFLLVNLQNIQMWFCLGLIIVAVILYANSKIAMEVTSIFVLSALMVFYYYFPLPDANGDNILSPSHIYEGFANPALISVISLLILGQAIIQTGMLNEVANIILKMGNNNKHLSIGIALFVVMLVSSILNNTPVVVIFIPIMASLAKALNLPTSKVLMPLSFASILGGMTTLIGSSTNLLVSGVLKSQGLQGLSFFEFTGAGIYLAGIGLLFLLFIAPKLLPSRDNFTKEYISENDDDRQFLAQFEVSYESNLVGKAISDGNLPEIDNVSIKMIKRGEHALIPPFDDNQSIKAKDILIVTARKDDLSLLMSKNQDFMKKHMARLDSITEDDAEEEMFTAEIIVSPSSKVVNQTIQNLAFYRSYDCTVLAIQRQSRMLRSKISDIRLNAGDVLLVMGTREAIFAIQESKDFVLLEYSAQELHAGKKALPTAIIFTGVVSLAAFNLLPISVGSFIAVGLCLILKCLTVNQAMRAIDMRIIVMIAASLALGQALQATGGAEFIANKIAFITQGISTIAILAVLFLTMVIMTNILSNNSTAVLFTPIAVNLAQQLNLDVNMFVFCVIFACNCSFATPIGYQTNLMVMGPGHYKFSDFTRAGLPLAFIIFVAYISYVYLFML